MTAWPTCADCGEQVINQGAHLEACVGPRPLTVLLARKILDGSAYHDSDAERVARAYLELTGNQAA